jgi:hypothetical protein
MRADAPTGLYPLTKVPCFYQRDFCTITSYVFDGYPITEVLNWLARPVATPKGSGKLCFQELVFLCTIACRKPRVSDKKKYNNSTESV